MGMRTPAGQLGMTHAALVHSTWHQVQPALGGFPYCTPDPAVPSSFLEFSLVEKLFLEHEAHYL
jgi:hypothetical protein